MDLTHTPVHRSLALSQLSAYPTDHGIYIATHPAGAVDPAEAAMSATHMQIALLSFLAGIGLGYVFFKRGV